MAPRILGIGQSQANNFIPRMLSENNVVPIILQEMVPELFWTHLKRNNSLAFPGNETASVV
jgi:hypothetical protein